MNSLEQLCLNLIVGDFERFYFAFVESKNECLNRSLKFLQRKYTSEFFSELFKRKKIKDVYLEFLLNEHLKIVEYKWLSNSCYEMEEILHHLPNLTKLSCSGGFFTDKIVKNITQFCPKIVEIEAIGQWITDIGRTYLCKNENGKIPCPDLKNLYIEESFVSDEGVKHLIQNLPSLERIDYENVPQILYTIHKEDLHNLEKLPKYNLVHLDLFNRRYLPFNADLLKICLTVCPKLKILKCFISDENELELFNNTCLNELDLWIEADVKFEINNFLRINGYHLISLKVHNCRISIGNLAVSCPKLQCFKIDYSDFLDDPDDSQCIFPCLTECTFDHIKSDRTNNKAMNLLLSSSPNLECLTFSSCELTLETKIHLLKFCENSNLKCITFSRTQVDVRYVKDIILNCSSLKTLKLEYWEYFPEKEKELAEFVKTLSKKPDVYAGGWYINDIDYELDEY